MLARLEIRLFGGVRIRRDGALLGGFISAKAPALLAYLVSNPGPHGREALAGLLWGEMPEADARNNLRQTLSNLRKKVGDHLLITRTHVAFNFTEPYWLDVEQFEAWTKQGQDADALQEAVSLYRGDFLAGLSPRHAPAFEEWMLAQRARYRELALWALQRLLDEHLRRRELGQAMDTATRLLALDPWREEAHRQLMRALVYSGQRTAALAQFEKCRRVLYEELGVAPSVETARLYERIRALGDASSSNLPSASTPFFGRERELARIRSWTTAQETRLLTIVGPGGVGKSRLALTAARIHASDFLEGAWLVPLISTDQEASLARAVAVALGLQLGSGPDVEAQLLHFLQEREMLLVLDNMEHLLSAENLTWLAALLARSPAVKLLATSRERLNLHAETVLELGGLPFAFQGAETQSAEQGAGQGDQAGYGGKSRPGPPLSRGQAPPPAAQLFLARARQVRPDFDGIGQEAAVERLCQLVDGLPLAIELAASWMRAMALEDILAEVERGLDFLRATWQDLPERHRSLQAVFEHSWRMLTPEERDIYARLGVFGGGFSAQAAQAVAGASFASLASLVDKSLLTLEDGRYTRHPMLRQFAVEKLQADPLRCADVRRAHARYYAQFMRQMEPILFGGAIETALGRVAPELKNLQLAWEIAATRRLPAVINDLADGLTQIVDFFGLYREGRALALSAIRAFEGDDPSPGEETTVALARAHGLAAVTCTRLGENETAKEHARTALRLLSSFPSRLAYAHSLVYAGVAAYSGNELQQAVSYWQEGAKAYRAAGSKWGECVALNNLSEVMLALGRIQAARQYADSAYALALEMQNSALMATTRQILAGAALEEGDAAAARAYAEEALALHRQTGYRVLSAHTLVILARIARMEGDLPRVADHLQESIAMFRQLGAQVHLRHLLVDLGAVSLEMDRRETAMAALSEARSLARASGDDALASRAERLLAACSPS